MPPFQVNKQLAALVERLTGVPAAVTQKVADRIVDSGMLEPKKISQQVNAARMIGKMAVQFGSQKLASKLQDVGTTPTEQAAAATEIAEPNNAAPAAPTEQVAEAILDLAIDDYTSLKAIDIISRLDSLDREQLSTISKFEAANRGRRTIISKIDQLLAR